MFPCIDGISSVNSNRSSLLPTCHIKYAMKSLLCWCAFTCVYMCVCVACVYVYMCICVCVKVSVPVHVCVRVC